VQGSGRPRDDRLEHTACLLVATRRGIYLRRSADMTTKHGQGNGRSHWRPPIAPATRGCTRCITGRSRHAEFLIEYFRSLDYNAGRSPCRGVVALRLATGQLPRYRAHSDPRHRRYGRAISHDLRATCTGEARMALAQGCRCRTWEFVQVHPRALRVGLFDTRRLSSGGGRYLNDLPTAERFHGALRAEAKDTWPPRCRVASMTIELRGAAAWARKKDHITAPRDLPAPKS